MAVGRQLGIAGVLCERVCVRFPGWVQVGLGGEYDILGSDGREVVAVGVFVVRVVGVLDGCCCERRFRSVVPGLLAVSLFLPFVFCGVPVFPCVLVSWSFGGLGFCVVIVLRV